MREEHRQRGGMNYSLATPNRVTETILNIWRQRAVGFSTTATRVRPPSKKAKWGVNQEQHRQEIIQSGCGVWF